MTTHYLKIALRNILKYKTQNVISVLSVAVSAMLLVVAWSFEREMRPITLSSQPYGERSSAFSPYRLIDGQDAPVDFDIFDRIRQHEFRSAERIVGTQLVRTVVDVTGKTDNGDRTTIAEINVMDADFLHWLGIPSSLTGKTVASLKDGEMILGEQIARQLFGTIDIVGKTVEITPKATVYWPGSRQTRSYRVVDVIHPSPFDSGADMTTIAVKPSKDMVITGMGVPYVQLAEGCSFQDFEREVQEFCGDDYHLSFSSQYAENNRNRMLLLVRGVTLFLVFFLAACLMGYLRMQTQLFHIRQREIALRSVLGARRRQILVQLFIEVCLMLLVALGVTLCFNQVAKEFLRENFNDAVRDLAWTMDNFAQLSVLTYAAVAVACLAVVGVALRNIRRRQTGLAMQMRPSRRTGLSSLTMVVQIFLCTIFIGATLTMNSWMKTEMAKKCVPENDYYYSRCVRAIQLRWNGEEKARQVIDAFARCEDVERVVEINLCNRDADLFDPYEPDNPFSRKWCFVYFQKDREVLDFFGIKPTIINPGANPERSVYVTSFIKEQMERLGLWERGTITIGGTEPGTEVTYDIAGYFDGYPYRPANGEFNLIATNADEMRQASAECIIVAKDGCYGKALQEINDAYQEIFPGRIDARLDNFRDLQMQDCKMIELMKNLFLITAIISIITTVASLYSIVALDTRRRRKEVALRKIHGASTRIIGRLFLRRYFYVSIASFIVALPVSILAFSALGLEEKTGMQWFSAWIAAATTVIVIVALTIGWKIREVMHLQPADWLKE